MSGPASAATAPRISQATGDRFPGFDVLAQSGLSPEQQAAMMQLMQATRQREQGH